MHLSIVVVEWMAHYNLASADCGSVRQSDRQRSQYVTIVSLKLSLIRRVSHCVSVILPSRFLTLTLSFPVGLGTSCHTAPPPGELSCFWCTSNFWHTGNFSVALSRSVAIFSFVQSKKKERKDECKHSWLLKGEIYSWVIKVYDWILPAIGCSGPRGTRSMNMNFMLLSILWSFPCISSRLRWGVQTTFFFFNIKTLHTLVLMLLNVIFNPISDFLTEGSSGQSPPLAAAACVYPPPRRQ